MDVSSFHVSRPRLPVPFIIQNRSCCVHAFLSYGWPSIVLHRSQPLLPKLLDAKGFDISEKSLDFSRLGYNDYRKGTGSCVGAWCGRSGFGCGGDCIFQWTWNVNGWPNNWLDGIFICAREVVRIIDCLAVLLYMFVDAMVGSYHLNWTTIESICRKMNG